MSYSCYNVDVGQWTGGPMNVCRCIAVAACLSLAGVVVQAPAYAQDAQTLAEKHRLVEEMKKLATRNAWGGVERSYLSLVDLRLPIEFDVHFLGAEAARSLGKTYPMYRRLERAAELDPQPEVLQTIKAMEKAYGRLRIVGNPRWKAELVRPSMPFAPDERKSIEFARSILLESGNFEGMVPVGDYQVGGKTFTVEAGTKWQEVVLERSDIAGREGVVIYAGPILSGGYSFLTSPASDQVSDGDGVHMASPAAVSGSGVSADGGGEIGFTREFGVALTVGYRGLYGTDTFHSVTGWLATAIRPGDLRIALGPSYGLLSGSGTGVADWFDIKQDPAVYPVEDLAYAGRAWMGGFAGSVGYGILDVGDTMQGAIELGGAWHTDGARSYMGFGLRVGIVPKVPRFEES